MIVRYARERGYKGLGKDPILTLGRNYVVLGVLFRPHPYVTQINIETNVDDGDHSDGKPYSDGGPGVFDMSFFDVVDPRVPSGWSLVVWEGGRYRLEPDEFAGDFWDRFHDADAVAEKVFDRVIKKVKFFHAS